MKKPEGYAKETEGGYILLPVVTLIALLAAIAYMMNNSGGMNIHLTGGRIEDDQAYFVGEAGVHHARWQIRQRGSFADIPVTTFGNGPHSYSATISPKTGFFPVKISVSVQLSSGAVRTVSRYYDPGEGGPGGCNPDNIPNENNGGFSTGAFGGGSNIWGITYLPEGQLFSGVASPADGAWILSNYNADTFYLVGINGSHIASFDPDHSGFRGLAFVLSGANAGTIASVIPGTQRVHFIDLDGNDTGDFRTDDYTSSPKGISFISTTETGLYQEHLAISSEADQVVYIVDQSGGLKNTIDVSTWMTQPAGVAHFVNTNKLLVMNETGVGYIFDFAGVLYGQYSGADMGVTHPRGAAINPERCEHVFVDRDDSNVEYVK
ncbi:MAG: hypothetical protein ACE5FU_07005 [Nitrospinota bacterium]